jgi:hypothetical protein
LSEKRNSFFRLWKTKGFKEESMAKVGLYAIGTAAILESNKSLLQIPGNYPRNTRSRSGFLAPVGGIFLSSRTAAGRGRQGAGKTRLPGRAVFLPYKSPDP